MTDNYGTTPVQDYGTPIPPVGEPPKKSNTTLIIVIVALVLLCCCCLIVLIAGGAYLYNNGDQIFNLANSLRNLLLM